MSGNSCFPVWLKYFVMIPIDCVLVMLACLIKYNWAVYSVTVPCNNWCVQHRWSYERVYGGLLHWYQSKHGPNGSTASKLKHHVIIQRTQTNDILFAKYIINSNSTHILLDSHWFKYACFHKKCIVPFTTVLEGVHKGL